MLREWIQKHRAFLKKSGGMQEKKDSTALKSRISTRILEQFNERIVERRLLPDRRVNGGQETDPIKVFPLPI